MFLDLPWKRLYELGPFGFLSGRQFFYIAISVLILNFYEHRIMVMIKIQKRK